jgi:hypothetical protein
MKYDWENGQIFNYLANSRLCAQALAQQTAGGYVISMNMGFQ